METIVQLLDEKTGNNVAPITHWNAVSNKPDLVTRSELSGVAQQGDNPDVSLTSIDEKIDGFYDTFDADIALQLQGIIGDTDESESESESEVVGTSQTQQQISELRTLQESINSLADDVNALKNAHVINNISVDGVVFEDGYSPSPSLIEYIINPTKIVEICDDYTTISGSSCYFNRLTNLKKLRFKKLITAGGSEWLNGVYADEIYFDKLETIVSSGYYGAFDRIKSKRVYLPKLKSIVYSGSGPFIGSTDLIDLVFGECVEDSIALPAWSPTNALNASSSSLIEPGETFANNLEKLLYNIREHIAANLPDRTGLSALTITFSAAVKAAINGDTATAQAFSNKNWTVA